MRIVSWNMNHRQGDESWAFLETLKPDVALLQETTPAGRFDLDHIVFREQGIGEFRQWGSAVISFKRPLKEITQVGSFNLCQTVPGSVAVAQIGGLIFVSQYGAWDHNYVITNVHRQLSDLTPLLDMPKVKVVLGADLNISSQFGGADGRRHRNALDRYATLGLIDCLLVNRPARELRSDCCKSPCLHVQTHVNNKKGKKKTPWQIDYIFASKCLEKSIVSCAASDHPGQWEFSDHCPLILDLDI